MGDDKALCALRLNGIALGRRQERRRMNSRQEPAVLLRLTSDEALVLDSLLSRFDSGESWSQSLDLSDPSERAALWALQAALERELAEPFRFDYDRLLAAAQKRLRVKAGL
jgi:hypothetical protein